MTRQVKILLVCLAGLLLALGYSYLRSPEHKRVARTEKGAAEGRVKQTKVSSPGEGNSGENSLPRLRLESGQGQESPGGDFVQSGKDLFAPLYSDGMKLSPPAAPADSAPAVPATESEEAPADFMPTVSADPMFESAPQSARFQVLGYLEIENRRVVFLETEGEVFLARRGESFGGEFRVVEMNDEQLVLSQRGVSRPITLELQGGQGVTQLGGSTESFSNRGRNVVPEAVRFR
jgi:hypothetical protein